MCRSARTHRAAIAASLTFALIATVTTTAAALSTVEAITSTVFQQNQSSLSGVGLRFRIPIPQLVEGFSYLQTIEYWRSRTTLADFDVKATRKDATLAALLRYDMTREGFKPYFGAGVGVHFLGSELDAPSLGLNETSESLIKGGLVALGGVKFPLTERFGNLLELQYHHVPDHHQVKFNWGLSYDF